MRQPRGNVRGRPWRMNRRLIPWLFVFVAFGGFLADWAIDSGAVAEWSGGTLTLASTSQTRFRLCNHSYTANCVIDGDTIHFKGQRIRMIDYDAPETGEPKCASERVLGHRATLRLLELLNSGPIEIVIKGTRDEDRYGRKLRLVKVNDRSVGDTLIAEGLAWPWQGRRHFWCGG